jgi:hypothetical protein
MTDRNEDFEVTKQIIRMSDRQEEFEDTKQVIRMSDRKEENEDNKLSSYGLVKDDYRVNLYSNYGPWRGKQKLHIIIVKLHI